MARPVRKRKRKARRTTKSTPMPGWVWGLFGLIVGLSVAAAVFVKDRETPPVRAAASTPAPKPAPAVQTGQPAPERPESRFKFYDMLPNFEVVIPEEDTVVRNATRPEPVATPGLYVLQAGSFSSHTDADRMKARLAMLGITSRIQRVSVDDKDYHRVRIGPVDSLEELNRLRGQLRNAEVDIMVIRVGD